MNFKENEEKAILPLFCLWGSNFKNYYTLYPIRSHTDYPNKALHYAL